MPTSREIFRYIYTYGNKPVQRLARRIYGDGSDEEIFLAQALTLIKEEILDKEIEATMLQELGDYGYRFRYEEDGSITSIATSDKVSALVIDGEESKITLRDQVSKLMGKEGLVWPKELQNKVLRYLESQKATEELYSTERRKSKRLDEKAN
jgi:hypothetical protein